MLEKITSGKDKIYNYYHKVSYHETDAMRIVHHSNYIKWMEDARLAYFDAVGLSYIELEEHGFASPVLGIEAKYKRPTAYGDTVRVETVMDTYNGLRFKFTYRMYVEDKLISETASEHCFTSLDSLRPTPLTTIYPAGHELIKNFLEGEARIADNL